MVFGYKYELIVVLMLLFLEVNTQYGYTAVVDEGFHVAAYQHSLDRVAIMVGDADQVSFQFL